jgi:hypothetical protein
MRRPRPDDHADDLAPDEELALMGDEESGLIAQVDAVIEAQTQYICAVPRLRNLFTRTRHVSDVMCVSSLL